MREQGVGGGHTRVILACRGVTIGLQPRKFNAEIDTSLYLTKIKLLSLLRDVKTRKQNIKRIFLPIILAAAKIIHPFNWLIG